MPQLNRKTLLRIRTRGQTPGVLATSLPNTKIDQWLVRIANGSQVGLLALAVFGYFYTVLPVYQKSLLDEEIAKKTLELNHKDADLVVRTDEIRKKDAELASKQRELEQRSAEVAALSLSAVQLKSALVQKQGEVGVLRSNLNDQYAELRVRLLQEFQQLGARLCSFPTLATDSFSSCLIQRVIPSAGLARWTAEDIDLMKHLALDQQATAERAWSSYLEGRRVEQQKVETLRTQAEIECTELKQSPEYADQLKRRFIELECDSRKAKASGEALQLSLKNYVNPEGVTREQLFAIAKKFAATPASRRSAP